MKTNRDLYLYVEALLRDHRDGTRPLADYLRALAGLAAAHARESGLTLRRFADLLGAGFTAPVIATEAALDPAPDEGVGAEYLEWQRVLWAQIADLDGMRASGDLDDEQRYFGIDGPSGARWYNFDPLTYLECAVAGTYGGWQPGDATGRGYVSGRVAVVDQAGRVGTADPRDLDDPIVAIPLVGWDDFCEFLWAGQSYE